MTKINDNDFRDALKSLTRKSAAYDELAPQLDRLMYLIGNNPEFFNEPRWGDSMLKTAIDKLQEIIDNQ